jgi:Uma2 family endonuclease
MAAYPKTLWTVREYLSVSQVSETRLELVKGEIYDMSGASEAHNTLFINLIGLLYPQVRKSPCKLFGADMRVRVNPDYYFYPDMSVVCGDPFYTNDQPPSLLNPVFIVEILSDSTLERDWAIKLPLYQALPSVQEILYIEQDRLRVHHIQRNPNLPVGTQWQGLDHTTPLTTLTFPSIGCTVRIAELYERLTFNS